MLSFLISVPWMLSTPPRPDTLGKRRTLFGAAALSQGLLLAPLVRASLALHPGVLFTAFAGTAGAFAARAGRAWARDAACRGPAIATSPCISPLQPWDPA